MSPRLTRRAALRGTAAAALSLTAGAVPALATPAPLHPNDARLVALADEAEAINREAKAHEDKHRGRETDETEEAFHEIVRRYGPIEEEIAATPADTMAGVAAKARAAQVPVMRGFDDLPFGMSLADDVWRLFGGGAA